MLLSANEFRGRGLSQMPPGSMIALPRGWTWIHRLNQAGEVISTAMGAAR
jgi:hypothetical protein